MALFRYKIITPTGNIVSDSVFLPFDDTSSAIRFLERQGSIVLDISKVNPFLEKIFDFYKRSGGIKRTELAEFFNNLSILLKSGVTILGALEEINKETKNKKLNFLIKSIITEIEMGHTFSEALSRYKKIFSPLIIYMIQIGEETGRLDEALKRIRDHLLRVDKIINDTKRAIRYPLFLLFMLTVAFSFWFWFVVPKIVNVFKDMGIPLPWPTRLLLFLSGAMKTYFPKAVLCILIISVIFFVIKKKIPAVNYFWHRLILSVPIISQILEISLTARICESIGILLSAGVSIIRVLEIIINTTQNMVYKKRLKDAMSYIEVGNSLSDALNNAKALNPFVIRMVHVGEETGRIPEQMEYISSVYREKLEYLVDSLSKSLEPILLIIIGIFFAAIMIGMLLPLYDLVSSMGKM